jgi:signal transduction histidine kinase
VIALNRQFNLIFSNRVATQLLQQTPNYTLKRLIDVLPKDILPKNYAKVLRDIRRFGVHVYEIGLQDKTYQCHLGCWGHPKIEGWVAVLHDVSELKELDRIKSEMVRMTSHDLKNPLQAALANLDLLRDDLENTSQDQEVTLSLNNVERQLTKMQRIIGGILDLERVRMGVHLNELCQPNTIVENVLDELADIVRDKRIHLHHTIAKHLPDFLGDRAQFERALVNLVDNAIKFTPSGGQVDVAVRLENDEIVFSVKDNGVGVPKELHEKIFERFFRGQQKGIEHISGTGLGLSLVKAVAESHHGRVWVDSQLGEGATFFIAVPMFRELMYTPKAKEIPI